MHDIENRMFITINKSKGHHGPAAFKSVSLAARIFVRLNWAWEEAVEVSVPAETRYKIIQEIALKFGETMSLDAIRKGISKHLRDHPYLNEKTTHL
jgi:hypothetical protein